MEAHEIREKGRLVKTWEKPDGAWYKYKYEIWEVQGKYYQIQDYVCNSFSGTMEKRGMVTEIEKPEPLPTHMGIMLGVHKGDAWVEDKFQGTPDQIAEWYYHRVKKVPYYRRDASFYLKVVELSFDQLTKNHYLQLREKERRMTVVDQIKRDIILAAEYLKNNPDWQPCWSLPEDHCRAVAEVVDELSSDQVGTVKISTYIQGVKKNRTMAKYRITYETSIEVEASDEVEARELSCEMDNELLMNLQEINIEKV